MRYVAAWLLAGGIAAVAGLQLLRGAAAEVSLPPVRETELLSASTAARCELRRDRTVRVLPRVDDGPRRSASRPGVYEQTPPQAELVGAIRRGIIVIHYRPSLGEQQVEQLRRLQKAVPRGTILTPNPDMRYAVAVTGWRRLLGCHRFRKQTMDAIRFFRGRYIGSGPGH